MEEVRNLAQLLSALKRGYTVMDGAVVRPQAPQAARKRETERSFCVSIAGHYLGIHTRFTDLYAQCRDYLREGKIEIQVNADEEDMARERNDTEKDQAPQDNSNLENLAIHRKISEAMLDWDTFLMHGAVIAVGQSAYMFTAASGTGKSTHVQKWIEKADGAFVVNGDKPLIKVTEEGVVACGTPWCGKEKMGANVMVPLKAIAIMERGENNEIREISFGEAFSFLLQQTYRPDDPEKMKKTLTLLSRLNGKVRFYKFIFNNLKEDAFSVFYQALVRDKA